MIDDEAVGLVVVEAVLPMPPVVTGAGFPGCFAADTASYDKTLGPMFQDALLRIPPVIIEISEIYWGRCSRILCSGYRQ